MENLQLVENSLCDMSLIDLEKTLKNIYDLKVITQNMIFEKQIRRRSEILQNKLEFEILMDISYIDGKYMYFESPFVKITILDEYSIQINNMIIHFDNIENGYNNIINTSDRNEFYQLLHNIDNEIKEQYNFKSLHIKKIIEIVTGIKIKSYDF